MLWPTNKKNLQPKQTRTGADEGANERVRGSAWKCEALRPTGGVQSHEGLCSRDLGGLGGPTTPDKGGDPGIRRTPGPPAGPATRSHRPGRPGGRGRGGRLSARRRPPSLLTPRGPRGLGVTSAGPPGRAGGLSFGRV